MLFSDYEAKGVPAVIMPICHVLALAAIVAAVILVVWQLRLKSESEGMIKAGYVQAVDQGRVIWVKPKESK